MAKNSKHNCNNGERGEESTQEEINLVNILADSSYLKIDKFVASSHQGGSNLCGRGSYKCTSSARSLLTNSSICIFQQKCFLKNIVQTQRESQARKGGDVKL